MEASLITVTVAVNGAQSKQAFNTTEALFYHGVLEDQVEPVLK